MSLLRCFNGIDNVSNSFRIVPLRMFASTIAGDAGGFPCILVKTLTRIGSSIHPMSNKIGNSLATVTKPMPHCGGILSSNFLAS